MAISRVRSQKPEMGRDMLSELEGLRVVWCIEIVIIL